MDIELTQILHRLLPNIEWVMNDDDLSTLVILTPNVSNPTVEDVQSMRQQMENELMQIENQRQELLARLGITQEEAKLLLGGN